MSRTIKCANFWDALILRSLLGERGVQVRQPDEVAPLSIVAFGDLDRIKAAVAQLGKEFPRSGPVIIEGEPGDDRMPEPSSEPKPPEPIRPAERFARPKPISEPEPTPPPAPAQALEPAQEVDRTQVAEPAPAPELTQVLGPTQAAEPMQAAEPAPAPESPSAPEPPQDGEPSHPPQQPGPFPAPEPAPGLEPTQAAEPLESPELTHTPEQPEPLPASEPASEGQVWAVLYDGGMSLTTANERIARSLAEAERQRGHRVTVRRLDDIETHPRPGKARPPGRARDEGPVRPRGTDKPSVPGPSRAVGGADSVPEPEPIRPAERFARPKPISEPESAPAPEPAPPPEPAQALEPVRPVEPAQDAEPVSVPGPASEASPPVLTREPEPAHAPTPTRRRRLLLYALAAASIVVAAALVDHWGVLPTVGANTASPAQVGGPSQRPQLLPPLDQTPVMHFSNAVDESGGRAIRRAELGRSTSRVTDICRKPAACDGCQFRRRAFNHCTGRMTLMRTRATATTGTAVPVRAERARTLR
jgi:hypothetical protein